MRVLLADDHALVRAGLRALVAQLPNVTEVLEASDGYEALARVVEHHPEVVLMDITMPRMNGLEATWRIRREFPETRVIILSVHRSEEYLWRALRAGASGYLVKAGTVAELENAVRAVTGGETYISPTVERTNAGEDEPAIPPGSGLSPLERLSPRQREVLQLIAEGMSSRQIAERLGIQIKTVDSHRTLLMNRLGIHDVAGLVRYAIRNGLVPSE